MTLHTRPRAGERYVVHPPFPSESSHSGFPVGDQSRAGASRDQSTSTGGPAKSALHSREKLKLRRRGHDGPRRTSSHIHVRAYHRPSWFSSLGVRAKRKRLERKGLPNFHNWRFITLTIDQTLFSTPLEAYLAASDHMRRFLYACRKAGLWSNKAKWCWKLEFQRNGWPHWHLLVEKRSRIDYKKLNELWNFGEFATDVKRVNERGFSYNFKYAFKATEVEGEEGVSQGAPDWFLDYVGSKEVPVKFEDHDGVVHDFGTEQKPVTFARARFWQTSRGFYTGRKLPVPARKRQEAWAVTRTVRQIEDHSSNTVQVVARRGSGQYRGATLVRVPDLQHFWNLVGFDTVHAGAVGLGVKSFIVPTHRITNNLDPNSLWQLKPLLQQNSLTLRHGMLLQHRGLRLRTC